MLDMNILLQIRNAKSTQILTGLQVNEFLGPRDKLVCNFNLSVFLSSIFWISNHKNYL